jgi:hypothetical protein
MSPLNCVKEGPRSSDGWSGGFLKSPASSLPVGPTLYLGPESRFSGGLAQFGRICAMEREIKAGLRRRSSRRVNMMARRNPARAPRNPSVIERLLKVRRPWPVRRNPVYARTTVQTIARTFTGPHTPTGFSKVISTVPPPEHLHYFRSACDGNTGNPVCGRQPKPATRHARWGSKLYPVGSPTANRMGVAKCLWIRSMAMDSGSNFERALRSPKWRGSGCSW